MQYSTHKEYLETVARYSTREANKNQLLEDFMKYLGLTEMDLYLPEDEFKSKVRELKLEKLGI